jgi:zinc transport system permease protein
MESFLSYAFMQRALFAGIGVSITCAILGLFLVLRRDAMIGHGLAHVTFGGVALGLLLSFAPLLVTLAVSVVSALGILKLKERAGLYGDTAIGIVSSLGMALGILLVSLAGSFNVDLFGYLFGNVLAIESEEVYLSLLLAAGVLVTTILFYHDFFFLTFDPESARTSGIRVRRLETLMAVLAAVTIVLGMKVVGILLVSSLLILPAAAALQIARSFKQALVFAALLAGSATVGGLAISYHLDWPPSGTIVALSGLLFLLLFFLRKNLRRGGGPKPPGNVTVQ